MAGPSKAKNKGGRPTDYNEEIAQKILEKIESSDCGLQEICDSNFDFPAPDSIYRWMSKNDRFRDKYLLSKKRQVQVYVDKSFELLNKLYTDPVEIQLLKLKLDHIRWYASRLVPRLYGSMPEEAENKIKEELQNMLHEAMAKAIKSKERDY